MERQFPAYRGDEPYTFVCYAHEDAELVYPEIEWLNEQGIHVWYDEGIFAGKVWRAEIAQAIQGASKFIYYISSASLASDHCNREVDYALDRNFEVLPVYIEDVELTPELDLALSRVQALHRDQDANYPEHLLNALGEAAEATRPIPRQTPGFQWRRGVPIGFATAVLIGVGWWVADALQDTQSVALETASIPSIAVLPFRWIGEDTQQWHFADGMTDDLITDLSQISRLFVVARNSVFEFKGQEPSEVAQRLGVRYVLQGSVRRVGEQYRVNAQLIEAASGGSIWADRYDGALVDVLAFQDTVAHSVANALEVELTDREREAVGHPRTADAEAREAFQRGWALYRQNTPRAFALAIEHFDTAIARDPSYLRAYAARAAVYQAALVRDFTVRIGEWTRSLGLKPDDVMRNVLSNLRTAAAEPSSLTLQVQAKLSLWRNNYDQAIEAANAAIALAPNDPLGHEALSAAQTLGGDPQAGLASIEKAMRLDPAYPDEYLLWHGLALFTVEDYAEAQASLELAMELNPGDDRVLIVLAATYGHLGRRTEAQRIVARLDDLQGRRRDERTRSAPGDIQVGIDVQLEGRYTLTEVDLWPFRHIQDRERLRDGLRLGGLREMGPEDNQIPLEMAGATTVSIDEAWGLHKRGVAVVDVRGLTDRNIGFIPGSTFLNLQTTLSEAALRAAVDPDAEVLFHCEGMR